RPAAARSGEILLLSPRAQSRHAALDAEEKDPVVGNGLRLLRSRHEYVDPPDAARSRRRGYEEPRQDAGGIRRRVLIHAHKIRTKGAARYVPLPELGFSGGLAPCGESRW